MHKVLDADRLDQLAGDPVEHGAALSQHAEGQEPVAMWQGRPVGSTTHPDHGWREVSPTKDEPTVEQRVAYLRTLKRADGSPAYEFRALYTRPAAQPVQVQVPEGWRLVPVDLTPAMLMAGNKAAHEGGCDLWQMTREILNAWPAMLAAAPLPPAQPQEPVNRRPHSAESIERAVLTLRELAQANRGRGIGAVMMLEEQIKALGDQKKEPVNRRLLDAAKDLHTVLSEAMSTGGWVPTPLHASFGFAWDEMTAAIAEAEAQQAAQPEPRVEFYTDEPVQSHSMSIAEAARVLSAFFTEFPGGVEEMQAAQPVGREALSREQKDAICQRAEDAMRSNCNLSWREALMNETQRELGITGEGV